MENTFSESYKSRYFEIHHEVLINKALKICSSFTGSLKCKKPTQKCLILWNLLGSSYKKMLMKNPKYVLHSLCVLETH